MSTTTPVPFVPRPVPAANAAPTVAAGVTMNTPKPGLLGSGSTANNFDQTPSNATCTDIVLNYPWTPSLVKNRNDIPFIQLIEHRNEESLIKRQLAYYGKGLQDTAANIAGKGPKGLLSVYDEIWPDNPTNWIYRFPYFNKTHYELNTPLWSMVDKPGEILKAAGSGLTGFIKGMGGPKIAEFLNAGIASADAVAALGETALGALSPLVGTVDRPRIFSQHSGRSITVQFPLYNTIQNNDWKNNRDFFYRFATQNLFNKVDFITGLPPVWYRVYIPGQYYSHASCVTNFNVENLGNTRLVEKDFIVPDAYQISITLEEMLMPSANQFQAVTNGDANNRVTTAVKASNGYLTAEEVGAAFDVVSNTIKNGVKTADKLLQRQ